MSYYPFSNYKSFSFKSSKLIQQSKIKSKQISTIKTSLFLVMKQKLSFNLILKILYYFIKIIDYSYSNCPYCKKQTMS